MFQSSEEVLFINLLILHITTSIITTSYCDSEQIVNRKASAL